MAYAQNTGTKTEGNKKITAKYSIYSSGCGYSIITDDIKNDFNFLINDIPNKLDSAMNEINGAADIDYAFHFENNNEVVKSLSVVQQELKNDIANLKGELERLHQAFMTDIDNINMELEYNFGWIIIGDVKGSQRTEVVESVESSTE